MGKCLSRLNVGDLRDLLGPHENAFGFGGLVGAAASSAAALAGRERPDVCQGNQADFGLAKFEVS